jgi:PAS domain-containing protein
MLNKNDPNTSKDGFWENSSVCAVPDLPQQRFQHDYADADILKLSTFLRSNPNPILVFSPEGHIIKANPAAERLLKRLAIAESDLLPEEHQQIVRQCLEGRFREYGTEVSVNPYTFALTYHPLPAFRLVYAYAIETTELHRAEAELLRIANHTLILARQAIHQLQSFRASFPRQVSMRRNSALDDFFVAMDGCIFSGDGEVASAFHRSQ